MRRGLSPRYRLLLACSLPFRKSLTDAEGERWVLPPVWIDLANNGPRGVCLKALYVRRTQRGKGHAGRVLTALCAAADATGISIFIQARSYGRGSRMSTNALRDWYARHGFIDTSVLDNGWIPMVRRPIRKLAVA